MRGKRRDYATIQGTAKKLGVKTWVVESWVESGKLECLNGKVDLQQIDTIRQELDRYVMLQTFLAECGCPKLNANLAKDRNKYLDFLEEHQFFGLNVKYPENLTYLSHIRTELFINRCDVEQLKINSQDFFRFFGLSEKEKCELIISECTDATKKKALQKQLNSFASITPSVTKFITLAQSINFDTTNLNDLSRLLDQCGREVSVGEMLIQFVNNNRSSFTEEISKIQRKLHSPKIGKAAYPYATYVTIAKSLFNEESLSDNKVLEKSLSSSYDFECWLFLCVHFICGWRKSDICNNWPHPGTELLEKLGINAADLKDLLLNNRIDKATLKQCGAFIEKRIQLSATRPHKTKTASDLFAPISEELKAFFGRMALISVYHQINSKEGILRQRRQYTNYVRVQALFGDAILNKIGRRHISSLRLNKSYLQCLESVARNNGEGIMAAHTLASLARNHANIDTTSIYLRDHGLNGETADVVLEMMLDRGVFGSLMYQTLLTAFPEAFGTLSPQEQTKIMAETDCSAYELEILTSDIPVKWKLRKAFAEGDTEQANSILEAMYRISQGFGKSKDKGIFCKKRAIGLACTNPCFDSCLANACPHLVFTESGIKTLVDVVKDYKSKFKATGNIKYQTVLDRVIIPAYRDVLKRIVEKMSSEERDSLKRVIGAYYCE